MIEKCANRIPPKKISNLVGKGAWSRWSEEKAKQEQQKWPSADGICVWCLGSGLLPSWWAELLLGQLPLVLCFVPAEVSTVECTVKQRHVIWNILQKYYSALDSWYYLSILMFPGTCESSSWACCMIRNLSTQLTQKQVKFVVHVGQF